MKKETPNPNEYLFFSQDSPSELLSNLNVQQNQLQGTTSVLTQSSGPPSLSPTQWIWGGA